MPYKLIGHIPCGTEACTTATHSSSECNSVNGNINVDLTPVAKESTLLTESEAIKAAITNIDLSSVESKVEEESQAIQNKIDNIKLPEIDNIKLPEIDTTELASKDLERFWDVVPEDSEETISEEDIHAAVEDIWNTTFNS